MRVTGGTLKGRHTKTPGGSMQIRPAMDRMRESIFAILSPYLKGKSFLDLFSGSGTIAIESVSHGASRVSLCEMDKKKGSVILENVKMCEDAGVRISCHFMAVELFVKRCREQFDFIFCDPPFPYKFRKDLLEKIDAKKLLLPGGTVMIHYPSEDPLPNRIGNLVLTDKRIYGRSIVNFYKLKESEIPEETTKKAESAQTTHSSGATSVTSGTGTAPAICKSSTGTAPAKASPSETAPE
ncbi:MAG: 16S rRNA (guanine(966)-N(2))-methyltransferase RsmD [Treponema sp.]|nr:16S rRNA (guanine(966)-N(2))-methyltransferase RsmD [Treponema sp.]